MLGTISIILENRRAKPVLISGEMVNNARCPMHPYAPIFTPLLVGLGVRDLNPRADLLPAVKLLVRRLDSGEAETHAKRMSALDTGSRIRQECVAFTRALAPELFEI